MAHELTYHLSSSTAAALFDRPEWHDEGEIDPTIRAASPDEFVQRARDVNAYPIALREESLFTESGLLAAKRAIVASYQNAPDRCVGENGGRYQHLPIADYEATTRALIAAGAVPCNAISLCEGRKTITTFAVGDPDAEIASYLINADSYDGSTMHILGGTSVRTVCANTFAIALRNDGKGMAKLRHTASIEEKTAILRTTIADIVAGNAKVSELYKRASSVQLSQDVAAAAFDALFPSAPENATAKLRTRLDNIRQEARDAAALSINRVGTKGNLATLWNAATFLLDRRADGSARECRGGADAIDSMLFGSRAKRATEVQDVITELLLQLDARGELVANDVRALAVGLN